MAIQGVVVKIVDEDDPIHGNMATESINAMSQSYLGKSTYPLRDPAGGEVRSLYRVRPNRAQVLGTPRGMMRPECNLSDPNRLACSVGFLTTRIRWRRNVSGRFSLTGHHNSPPVWRCC
jgi:hypothetical protein